MGHARSSSSSSGEEDGDAEWKAAIDSIASADPFLTKSFAVGTSKPSSQNNDKLSEPILEEDPGPKFRPQLSKHYQIKAQKLLDDIVERNLEIVSNPVTLLDSDREDDGGGIQLFRTAPRGIMFDRIDEPQGPKKKPRILPGEEIDEKSKKFKRQLQSVVVDGLDVVGAAKAASEKSLVRLEARDAAAKAAVKREEERVVELKRIRGERWLPSIAKEMQLERQGKYNKLQNHGSLHNHVRPKAWMSGLSNHWKMQTLNENARVKQEMKELIFFQAKRSIFQLADCTAFK